MNVYKSIYLLVLVSVYCMDAACAFVCTIYMAIDVRTGVSLNFFRVREKENQGWRKGGGGGERTKD